MNIWPFNDYNGMPVREFWGVALWGSVIAWHFRTGETDSDDKRGCYGICCGDAKDKRGE